MTAAQIAEMLVKGNTSDARREILSSEFTRVGSTMRVPRDGVHAATLALDVAKALGNINEGFWTYGAALEAVRRCLDGSV